MLKIDDLIVVQDTFRLTCDCIVPQGARVAVIGPSGAGKSTLLGALAGFVDVSAGHIAWQTNDLTQLRPGARPIAMLFQDNNLFPHLTIEQNVALGLHPGLRLSQNERDQTRTALARVGLAGFETRRPGALSGGQQSRAALARVLVQKRPLILLDEPFAALGPALKSEMLDLVVELAEETGATLLMVSHEPEDARKIAPLTLLVADGTVTGPHPTAALLEDPPPVLAAYLGT